MSKGPLSQLGEVKIVLERLPESQTVITKERVLNTMKLKFLSQTENESTTPGSQPEPLMPIKQKLSSEVQIVLERLPESQSIRQNKRVLNEMKLNFASQIEKKSTPSGNPPEPLILKRKSMSTRRKKASCFQSLFIIIIRKKFILCVLCLN